MRESQELAQHKSMLADVDLVGVAANISDPGRGLQDGMTSQPASRPTDQPLHQQIDIHAVNCKQAIARDDAAQSSLHPLPV